MIKTQKLLKKARLITVFNAKGGVGKTAISLNAALTYGYGIMTNDPLTIISQVLDKSRYKILDRKEEFPTIPDKWPVIFDFGGYPDERAVEAIAMSEYVLIPVLPHKENIQANLNFIQEITAHKARTQIIIIINRTAGNQFFNMNRAIHRYFPDIQVFNMKKTAAFAWMVEHKRSLRDLLDICWNHKRYFKLAADQFDKIFEHMLLRNEK